MRESMARLTPRFSASRTVREYTERYYLPCASAYQVNVADNGAAARRFMDGQNALVRKLDAIRFGNVSVETQGDEHLIGVEVFLKDVSPDTVRVELYADADKGGSAVEKEMTGTAQPTSGGGGSAYQATVSASRPATDYTARIRVKHAPLAQDAEPGWMLWQK
jgi:starch phosphorylase